MDEEQQKLIEEIKEMETYKRILKDSFGGVMFNMANKNKYPKDINAKFEELEKTGINIRHETDGIFEGVYLFIMKE